MPWFATWFLQPYISAALFVAEPMAGLSTAVVNVPSLILFILEKLLLSIPMSIVIITINLIFCRSYGWSIVISFMAAMGVIVMVLQSALQAFGFEMLAGILKFTITEASAFTSLTPSLPVLLTVLLIAAVWTLVGALAGSYCMDQKDVL